MAKLLRMFQGKKAPHPPKRDYTDKQGERRTKTSMTMSDSDDESGGVFSASNESSSRGTSPTPPSNPPHSHGNVERFRFGSQTSYGTGTVDLKSCGGGSSSTHMGTNSRGTVGGHGGDGVLESRRRNDSGGGPKSPNTKPVSEIKHLDLEYRFICFFRETFYTLVSVVMFVLSFGECCVSLVILLFFF